MIYKNRFKPGDIVTWRDEEHATLTNGRLRLGNHLTIKETREITVAAQWEVGHSQHVTLMEDVSAGFELSSSCFSGSFFRHLSPEEKTTMSVTSDLDLTAISKSYPYLSLARQLGIPYGDVLILSDLYSPKLTVVSSKLAKPAQDRTSSVNKHLIHQLTCAVETGKIGHGG
jgi:hypothetical protein